MGPRKLPAVLLAVTCIAEVGHFAGCWMVPGLLSIAMQPGEHLRALENLTLCEEIWAVEMKSAGLRVYKRQRASEILFVYCDQTKEKAMEVYMNGRLPAPLSMSKVKGKPRGPPDCAPTGLPAHRWYAIRSAAATNVAQPWHHPNLETSVGVEFPILLDQHPLIKNFKNFSAYAVSGAAWERKQAITEETDTSGGKGDRDKKTGQKKKKTGTGAKHKQKPASR